MDLQSNLDNLPRTHLEQTIIIHKLITIHYFEYDKNFVFTGEKHNFWEFLYVDKGEIEVAADDIVHTLKQGMIIFHKPNEFHKFYAAKGKAPNLIVMTFDCRSRAMKAFADKVIQLEDEDRNLLAQIIKESQNAFVFPFGLPLERREKPPAGSEQMLRCYLEMFLIRLLRRIDLPEEAPALSTAAKEKNRDELTTKIIQYMEKKVDGNFTLVDLCNDLHISKTQLKSLFKQNTGYSVKEYFTKLKLNRAKLYIREETCNFTEISQRLGFNSVHSFSKVFKQVMQMSPSEYARSVKSRMGH